MVKRDLFLAGERIYVRGLRPEDFGEAMLRFVSDREVTKFLVRGTFPLTLEELRAQFLATIASQDEIQFAVCNTQNDLYLGVVGLHGVQLIARSAEFRILLGEKSAWGQGLGTEALYLMLAYGFETLNLNKIWLGVNVANQRAYNSYKKAGFFVEGELREEVYRNGQYYNVARMSLLRSEYMKLKDQWPIAKILAKQFTP